MLFVVVDDDVVFNVDTIFFVCIFCLLLTYCLLSNNYCDSILCVELELKPLLFFFIRIFIRYFYPWGGGSAGAGGPTNKTLAMEASKLNLGTRVAVDAHVFATGW